MARCPFFRGTRLGNLLSPSLLYKLIHIGKFLMIGFSAFVFAPQSFLPEQFLFSLPNLLSA